ncbi:hypothetical protein ZEAMMB73_Zm00001d044205 [Zea mays]|uniref:Myb/SANT-like domain-containing protein n=1 Tax=Zea mays TaxID=4577 RepID=A0A1D6NJK4_MAIZE|nr:hypothetical protein ZEAMMB73_Zm00001d044205 [Zea mays]ONM40442.1 hypothetical protein ZEAMMB73_Zm00001d044205 [Zea mays]
MVKEFHVRNKYVSFTKSQIQDKEGQLKRDYKMLKAAKQQSGSTWNERRNMVEGPPALWENLMVDTWLKGLGIALLLRHRKRKNQMSNFRMQKMDHKALI